MLVAGTLGPAARVERAMGIEPTLVAWEATVLPLNYARLIGKSNGRPTGEQSAAQNRSR